MFLNIYILKNKLVLGCFILLTYMGFSQTHSIEPDHIKTIILKPALTNTYAPIVKLGQQLLLSFDDLNAERDLLVRHVGIVRIGLECLVDFEPLNVAVIHLRHELRELDHLLGRGQVADFDAALEFVAPEQPHRHGERSDDTVVNEGQHEVRHRPCER